MKDEVKTIKGTVKVIKEITPWKTKTGKTMSTCGILVDDTWVNIREFSKEAAEQKLEGVKEGEEYLVYLDAKWGNVKSFVPSKDGLTEDPKLKNKSDEQLAKEAPSESMKDVVHKEKVVGSKPTSIRETQGGGSPTLSTNESIVRQVLYKVAGEILVKGTPAKEVNEYVKELEEGFYGGN